MKLRNCYDFDQTIYHGDASIRFLWDLCWRHFWLDHLLLVALGWLGYQLSLLSAWRFKEIAFRVLRRVPNVDAAVQAFAEREKRCINGWYLQQKQANDVICTASPQFLVAAMMREVNPTAVVVGTLMESATGKIPDRINLKGAAKVTRLAALGYTQFAAAYSDALSDLPLLDLAAKKYLVCGKYVNLWGPGLKMPWWQKIKALLRQLKIKHYIKNCLIGLPLLCSGHLFNGAYWRLAIWGYLSFCGVASMVYIINDLIDVKQDRQHLRKRCRPLAAYLVTPVEASVLLVLLGGAVTTLVGVIFQFNWLVCVVLGSYLLVNLAYSLIFKRWPLVDVFVLSSFYLVRVFYGGAIIQVGISKWLYLTILCAALFMAYGKRKKEKYRQGDNYRFWAQNMSVCLGLSVVFYALWVVNFNSVLLLLSIPVVLFILMRYDLAVERETSSGDPVEVLWQDPLLIFSCVALMLLIICALYLPFNWWWY